MKTILVPTDFSDIANKATLFAMQIAKKNKARVLLLHTYNMPIINGQALDFSANILYDNLELNEFEHFKANNDKLHRLAQEKKLDDVQLLHKLTMGELVSSVNECVEEEQVDLILMATSGGDDWFSAILGSNTDSLIQSGKVPTLVLPENFDVTDLTTIGFTTRYREKDKEALEKTIAFANKIKATVKCLYVETQESDVEKTVKENWESEYKGKNVHFFTYPSNEIFETIEEFIVQHEIDMLAMVTYKRSFFADLFTRRLTQKVSHNVDIPVLVFHD